mmetsp:Transcript_115153/g.332653  ORF Transcript_115153/g.332653 Transcript_115153/m.332653 type:complete len:246 (+) Transcript_115153:94-831(+)|eukprot:CAMPEP_0176052118 /NCGR_PEP_ID=MMETSP0120_2-20121206/25913_1 /TAXON_ID=160619 /ORGANISM="Kryptoperidinium foliaceum, Strain CCMP 1326" /LENGTH=245 /DNA_ID=CAMNT_0017385559 /DNA_START=23 /DNA_END=760 /DNA_ORIENTATION=-
MTLCDVFGCGTSGPRRTKVIMVRPQSLERLATALNVGRIPMHLAEAQPQGGQQVFYPLARRRICAETAQCSTQSSPVFLHVYDTEIANIDSKVIKSISGISIHHVGIEVNRQEFCFSSDGILVGLPGKFDCTRHHAVIPVGSTELSNSEILDLLQVLHMKYHGDAYRIAGFNCQTFAVELCEGLGLRRDCIPPEYRRFADGLLQFGWGQPDPDFDENSIPECFSPEAYSLPGHGATSQVHSRIRL